MKKFPEVNLKDLPYAKYILQQVREEAGNLSGFWVCDLISQTCKESRVLREEGAKITERIQSALQPYSLVTHWLYENGGGREAKPNNKNAYRRQWIDHMLKELES